MPEYTATNTEIAREMARNFKYYAMDSWPYELAKSGTRSMASTIAFPYIASSMLRQDREFWSEWSRCHGGREDNIYQSKAEIVGEIAGFFVGMAIHGGSSSIYLENPEIFLAPVATNAFSFIYERGKIAYNRAKDDIESRKNCRPSGSTENKLPKV